MPYTFYPRSFYDPFEDWLPSFGYFERNQPAWVARPVQSNFFFQVDVSQEHYRQSTDGRGSSRKPQKNQQEKDSSEKAKKNDPDQMERPVGRSDVAVGHRMKPKIHPKPSTKYSTKQNKPQNNLRSEERLNELKDIKKTGVDLRDVSKIVQNNSEISTTEVCVNNECPSTANGLERSTDEELKTLCDGEEESKEIKEETSDKMGTNNSSIKEKKLKTIEEIGIEVQQLSDKVQGLKGDEKLKEFLYLEEMLTKCLLRLDDIATDGLEDIRKSRKAIVEKINTELQNLEDKMEARKQREEENSNSKKNSEITVKILRNSSDEYPTKNIEN